MPLSPWSVPLAWLALLAPGPGTAAGQGELLELLPRPAELWVEVPDLDRLSSELARTSLGQLAARLAEGIDPEEIALRLSLPEEALAAGASLENSGVRGILRALALELGLSADAAERLVASLGGSLTVAKLAPVDEDRPGDLAGLVLAASLVPGGSRALADRALDALEGAGIELVELAREQDEVRAAWRWQAHRDVPSGYLIVRPGLAACTFERDLAEAILRGPAAAAVGADADADDGERDGALASARAASLARGELVFARVAGARLARAARTSDLGPFLERVGLAAPVALELALGTRAGQLTSRLRFELPPPPPGEERVRPAAARWSSLEALPSDVVAVVGVALSPWSTAQLVAGLLEEGGGAPGELLAALGGTPLFGALRDQGGLLDETLLFVRGSGPGIPPLYAASPSTAALDKAFQGLERRASSELALGNGLYLRPRPLPDGEAWILVTDRQGSRRSVLALTRTESTWVGSDVSAQLQGLLRQRARERLALRSEGIARVKAAVAAEVRRAGAAPGAVVAFLHVRAPALAELLWPYGQLALQLTGAIEDPEDLPDALEVAELLGDTTVVVLDLGQAVEIRGCGLLGGLALIF